MGEAFALSSPIERVVVLRALTGLGDILCAVPALRALRAALPHAHVALLGMPETAELIGRYPEYVDELIPFVGFPGIPEKRFRAVELPAFYESMTARKFDLALQMQDNGLVANSLVVMLAARQTAGFYLRGHYCPDPELFMQYPDELPEIRRYLALMAFLGLGECGDHLEFPVSEDDRVRLRQLLGASIPDGEGLLVSGDYVCVHPGAMAKPRRWSPVGFARVADELAREGLTVIFTGRSFEVGLISMIRGLMRAPSLDLAGKTSLGIVAALIERARLLGCSDTGVSHLAAALGVRSVVIFPGTPATGSDADRWAPLDRRLHLPVIRVAGLRSQAVSVDSVLRAVRTQLDRGMKSLRLVPALDGVPGPRSSVELPAASHLGRLRPPRVSVHHGPVHPLRPVG